MTTETIEWFTPEEKTPPIGVEVLCVTRFGTDELQMHDDRKWSKPCWGPTETPQFWAYKPKGPR